MVTRARTHALALHQFTCAERDSLKGEEKEDFLSLLYCSVRAKERRFFDACSHVEACVHTQVRLGNHVQSGARLLVDFVLNVRALFFSFPCVH